MTTCGDLRDSIKALQGHTPETMQRSLGSINHVLVQADLAKDEHADRSVDPEAVLVLNLLMRIVELETLIEISNGRTGIPGTRLAAMFSEFL
jgi:hypothetical protein